MTPAIDQGTTDIVLCVLAVLIVPAWSILRGRQMAAHPDAPLRSQYLWMIARGGIVCVLVVGLWMLQSRPLAALGLDIPLGQPGRYGLLVAAILAVAALAVIVSVERLVKPQRLAQMRAQMREMKILPRREGELAWWIGVALMAGVWEELLYRGFLIGFFAPRTGAAGAVLLSTLVFAIPHVYQGWRGIPRSGAVGLAFGLLYVWTRSLWWLMALHALVDLFGGFVAWRIVRMREPVEATAI